MEMQTTWQIRKLLREDFPRVDSGLDIVHRSSMIVDDFNIGRSGHKGGPRFIILR